MKERNLIIDKRQIFESQIELNFFLRNWEGQSKNQRRLLNIRFSFLRQQYAEWKRSPGELHFLL